MKGKLCVKVREHLFALLCSSQFYCLYIHEHYTFTQTQITEELAASTDTPGDEHSLVT